MDYENSCVGEFREFQMLLVKVDFQMLNPYLAFGILQFKEFKRLKLHFHVVWTSEFLQQPKYLECLGAKMSHYIINSQQAQLRVKNAINQTGL